MNSWMKVSMLALSAALWACPAASGAQHDLRLWSTLNGTVSLNDSVSAGLFLQPRFRDDISQLERLVVRPSVSVRLGNVWSTALGYDAHLIESPADAVEHRIWQQIGARHNTGPLGLDYRARIEERIIESVDLAVRLRLRSRVVFPIGSGGTYSLVASEEVFLNLHSPSAGIQAGYGENRLFAGVGAAIGSGRRIEFGYQWQHVELTVQSQNQNNHTLMVGFDIAIQR